ncbi:MAG TPA: salicylate synthase [Cellvibrio sp.]
MTVDILEPSKSLAFTQSQRLEYAAALANSNLFHDYLIYEQGGECWFGGGVVRSITLFADRLESRDGDVTTTHKVNSEDLCQALSKELATWPGQWQAGGWACFELAYALKAPHLLTEEERMGAVPLLYLCQPEVSVSLNKDATRVVTESPHLERQVKALLNRLPSQPGYSAASVEIKDDSMYLDAVSKALDSIHDRTLEKVILSRKLMLDFTPDFVTTWLLGRRQNNPSRSFSLRLAGWQASGFSPEIVVSVDRNGYVTTEPLAGTRRMDGLANEDLLRFNELYSDPKETHEHAISVRLSFSEMQEVCTSSTVAVRQFMERKERGSVQHLASTVCGELKADFNAWHAFASLFPAVTASGIPKRESFAEIRRHEHESRGLYAGAVLRVGYDGVLDAALVLRSLLGHKQQAWLQAGAGVVGASHPERELMETTEKLGSVAPWVVKPAQ